MSPYHGGWGTNGENMSTAERVATNIKTRARARNVKMAELSEQLGLGQRSQLYTRLRTGNWNVDELARAAEILGCEPGDLYGDNPFAREVELSSYLNLGRVA